MLTPVFQVTCQEHSSSVIGSGGFREGFVSRDEVAVVRRKKSLPCGLQAAREGQHRIARVHINLEQFFSKRTVHMQIIKQ